MSRVSRFAPALLLVAIAVVAIIVATGGSDKYVVNARFKDAGGILKNYRVKVGGVPAGKVTKISLLPGDEVNVKMELDKDAAPIGPGASAAVRPVNLLGEKYVDLSPGNLNRPLPSGTVIPDSKTSVPVELDDVLNVLDPDTRGALRILINESGLALAGRGTDFNQTLTDLPPALDQARRVVGQVAAENANLERLIRQGNKVVYSMNARRNDFADLITSASKALQTAADRRAQLGDTVRTAPAALGQLRTTLTNLQSATNDLTPAAADLRQTTPSLASTLERLPTFANDAQATLDEAKAVSPQLDKLGRESTPTLRRLRPTAARLAQYSADSEPMVKGLSDGGSLRSVLSFMDDWAHVTDNRDGHSHVFRLRISLNKDLIETALQRYAKMFGTTLPNARKKERKAPTASAAPAAPAPSAPAASAPKLKLPKLLPAPLSEAIQQGVDDIGKTVTGVVGAVTDGLKGGESRKSGDDDTKKLLNYLLGP